MRTIRRLALAFAASLVLAGANELLRAEDPPADPAARAKELLAKIARAKEAKDEATLVEGLKEIPIPYKGTQDGAVRDSLRKEITAALKNAKMAEARKTA